MNPYQTFLLIFGTGVGVALVVTLVLILVVYPCELRRARDVIEGRK